MLTKESALSKHTKVLPGLFQKPAPMERACAPRCPQAAKQLPAGEWYDYFTGEKFTGGKHIRKTDGIPAYVRSGTLLPVAKPVNFVKPDQQFEITLRAYGDCKNATYRLVIDDGITYTTDYKVLTLTEDTEVLETSRYKIIGKTSI